MIFGRDQVALIRQGKMSATLLPLSRSVRVGSVSQLRRRFMRHDENGQDLGWTTEIVEDITPDGQRAPVLLTLVYVAEIELDALTADHARVCGFRTLTGLKTAWHTAHPRDPIALIVHFQLGDVRDRDRYLNWTGTAGGDYTMNPSRAIDPDAPVVPSEHLKPMITAARARDKEQRERNQREAEKLPLSERAERLEAIKRRRRVDITREIRVISQRLDRAERHLDSDDGR